MRQIKISQSITNRNSDSLDKYLNDINKIALLSMEEEALLAKKIREGDKAALDKLVKGNLRFVVSVAKNYQYKGLSLNDLISEGNAGLIKASSRFDETRGFKFISFAVWWIRQSILQALISHKRMIRLPGNQILGINQINKAINKLEQDLNRLPSYEEIAEVTGLSIEKISDYLSSATITYSLDMLTNEETGSTLMDTMINVNAPATDVSMISESDKTDINRMLKQLPAREELILKLFFGLDDEIARTLDDMVFVLGLSKERIRQLKDNALKTLRSYNLKSFLTGYN